MALGGAMLQGLAEAHHAFPSWLAGFDPWQLAMLAIAVPGPLFFLLVLTMPLTKSGGGAVRTAAVDEHAPRDFLPYARAHRATPPCVFGSIFVSVVATQLGLDRKSAVGGTHVDVQYDIRG